jgi:hypothetical protein
MGYQAPVAGAERRRFPRFYINLRSRLIGPAGAVAVWTVDLSGNGARIGLGMVEASAFDGPGWSLDLPRLGCFPVIRRWHRGNAFGVSLDIPLPEQEHLSGLLQQRFSKLVAADTVCL